MPSNHLEIPKGDLQDESVQKLSFATPDYSNFKKPEPILPKNLYEKPDGPLDCKTIQKLSFLPVCPPKKEDLPWARKAVFCKPQVPIECDTITKMSYLSPGYFVEECEADSTWEEEEEKDSEEVQKAPKAGL